MANAAVARSGGVIIDAETLRISGDVVGRDKIVQNIQHIYERALTAVEEAEQAKTVEARYLARGVSDLAQRLHAQASDRTSAALGSPYRGLLEYRLNDADIFMGRDQAIRELLQHLNSSTLTVLHSESGAGKTSLLQAGIAPRLIEQGHLPVYLRPYDTDPALRIKREFLSDPSLAPLLMTAPLRDFLRQVTQVIGSPAQLYLLLDQFEEFFTRQDEAPRTEFIRELAECLDDTSLNVRWVVALRSEYFGQLASFRPRIRHPFGNDYRLNRFTRDEARIVIARPIEQRGLKFEDGLIDRLLDDLSQEGIAPAQIQLVCTTLYDELKPDDQIISSALYQREGGAAGILRGHLERVLRRMPAHEQYVARRLLESLISSEQQRTIRTYAELIDELSAQNVPSQTLDVVLNQLIDSRLLKVDETPDGPTYELAHDYLLREIKLDPEVQARKAAQELLAQEVRAYRHYHTLLSEDRLKIIEPHRGRLPLTPEAEELLARSQATIHQAQIRRERLRIAIVVGAIVVALVSTGLAAAAVIYAYEARAATRLAWVHELNAQGQARFEAQPLLGLRLALEALALAPDEDIELRTSIEPVINQLASKGRVLNPGKDIRQLFASADGMSLVVDRAQGPDEVRRTADNRRLEILPANVGNVLFGPDPGSAAFIITYTTSISTADAMIGEIRSVVDGSLIEPLTHPVERVFFGPQAGSSVFVLDYTDVPGELRSSSDGRLTRLLTGKIKSVTFSRAAPVATFAVTYEDAPAELRHSVDGAPIMTFTDKVESVRFSSDPAASLLGIRYANAPAEVRRSLDGSLVTILTTKVANFYFSPSLSGAVFVVDYEADKGELRRTTDGSLVTTLPGEVVRALFSSAPGDLTFVVQYKDIPGEVRRVADGSLIAQLPGIAGFAKASPDPTGLYFVTFYSGTLLDEIRYMATGEVIRTFSNRVSDVDFSPDAEASFMIVDYSRVTDQIVRTADGLVLASLDDEVVNVTFSQDARYFVVDYENGRSELWAARPAPHRLLDMELGRDEYAFDVKQQRMMVRYSDGRTYLVDLGWLEAMTGNPSALSIAEVAGIACRGPLAGPLFDEHELDPYLKGQPALACR